MFDDIFKIVCKLIFNKLLEITYILKTNISATVFED